MNDAQTKQAEDLVRQLIALIGDDPSRPGLVETPKRVVKSWCELYSGYQQDPTDFAKVFDEGVDELVIMRGISFYSTCEHHMLPFFGTVSIGYLPQKGRVLGASKLARLTDVYARRLQIQERMTEQIAQAIMKTVEPLGVAVIVTARHLCFCARGVRQPEAGLTTSCLLGLCREDPATRAEVLSLLRDKG